MKDCLFIKIINNNFIFIINKVLIRMEDDKRGENRNQLA